MFWLRSIFVLFVVGMTPFFGVGPAASADILPRQLAQSSGPVWCLDVSRNHVRRVSAWQCKGKVVSAEEAKRIKVSRFQRIKRRVSAPKQTLFPGKRQRGSGTGFFVSSDGHVLTNEHVVSKCQAYSVTPSGRSPLVAKLIAKDSNLDLALLKVNRAPLAVASFREPLDLLPVEPIAVIGYPLRGRVTIKPVIEIGHMFFGRLKATRSDRFTMKIDVRRGNSGGPVLDAAGQIIGVVVATVNTPGVYAATGKYVDDVGIGIRQVTALDFLKKHKVKVQKSSPGTPLTEADLLKKGTGFVAQIGCWK